MKSFSGRENDTFRTLRGIDLRCLLDYLNTYLIEYRDDINLPKYVTFGVEIEYEGIEGKIKKYIENEYKSWRYDFDASLKLGGGEIVSPILTDNKKTWDDLKCICDYLNKNGVDTLHNSGGHIHYGALILGQDYDLWINFIKLYAVYEHILYVFSYGDKTTGRKEINSYANPVVNQLILVLNKLKELGKDNLFKIIDDWSKYYSLNFDIRSDLTSSTLTDKDTLEFRSPNGTTNHVVWQNNINAFGKLLKTVKEKELDIEYLDYRIDNMSFIYKDYLYNEINLKDVLEFVDLIFDNNLDKLNFLRQYIGDFRGMYEVERNVYKKKFTR